MNSKSNDNTANPYALEIVVPFSLEQSMQRLMTLDIEDIGPNYYKRVLVETEFKNNSLAMFVIKQQIRLKRHIVKTTIYVGSLHYDDSYNTTTVVCVLKTKNPYEEVLPRFIGVALFVTFVVMVVIAGGSLSGLGSVLFVSVAIIGLILGLPVAIEMEARYPIGLLQRIEKAFKPHAL